MLDPTDLPRAFEYPLRGRDAQVHLTGEVREAGGARSWANLCDSEVDVAMDAVLAEQLTALTERNVPAAALELEPRYVGSLIDAGGLLRSDVLLPLRFAPTVVREFVAGIEPLLFDIAFRTVTVARWRLGIPGPHQPLLVESRQWEDNRGWHVVPITVPVHQSVQPSGRIGERFRAEIQGVVASGGREPLAYELYREASVARYERVRSALVLAVAAVEVALVTAHTELVHGQAGATSVSPTPKFGKLLDVFLPQLAMQRPINGVPLHVPASVLMRLRAAQVQRNALVHRGTVTPTDDEIDEVLRAVHALLRFVDFYAGRGWALEMIDAEILGEAALAAGLEGAGDLIRAGWAISSTTRSVMSCS